MTFAATLGLGAVSGLTVFLGLPISRLTRPRPGLRSFLMAASVGVLIFILYDVLKNAGAVITSTLDGNRWQGAGYALVLAAGLSLGLFGLVIFERLTRRRTGGPVVGPRASGPGAMAATDTGAASMSGISALTPAARVSLFIAVGIGLHNFSEGLAIGQSARSGAFQLFYLLVIGFGLHNITEGFGVTGPVIGEKPSWRFLGILGTIAGGPTFIGTALGYQFASALVSVFFLALAAGAILYVIGELQHVGRKIGSQTAWMGGLLAGFLVAFATDLLLHVAGA